MDQPSSQNTGKIITSVVKAIHILELLSTAADGLTATEISQEMRQSVSATYHILNTLKQQNVIRQSDSRKYYIGSGLFQIAENARGKDTLTRLAAENLKALSILTGETSNLVVLRDLEVEYIAQAESAQLLKMFTQIGARVPYYCTGGGKAILAYLPAPIQQKIISQTKFTKFTEHTLSIASALISQLAEIRSQGFALDREERESGVTCIAAPIFNYQGEVICALSISGPTARLNQKGIEELSQHVITAAAEISHLYGYARV